MASAKGKFFSFVLVVDTFFIAFFLGFNAHPVLVVDDSLPAYVAPPSSDAATTDKAASSKASATGTGTGATAGSHASGDGATKASTGAGAKSGAGKSASSHSAGSKSAKHNAHGAAKHATAPKHPSG